MKRPVTFSVTVACDKCSQVWEEAWGGSVHPGMAADRLAQDLAMHVEGHHEADTT